MKKRIFRKTSLPLWAMVIATMISLFLVSCYKVKIYDRLVVAKVTTDAVSDITEYSAIFHGVVDSGSENINEVGFEYRESGSTQWQVFSATLSSKGTFAKSIATMKIGTAYEVRAYAKTSVSGIVYGKVQTFKTIITIYTAGYEINGSGQNRVKIWIDGVATNLTNWSNLALPWQMVVVGTDIYVAGVEDNGTNLVAKVWKTTTGGTVSTLFTTDGTNHASAYSIAVVGNDVYVAGVEDFVAKVWKTTTTGGTVSTLFTTDGTNHAVASSMVVVGSDIYVAGEESNGTNTVAKVWKTTTTGGTPTVTNLTDGTNYTHPLSMAVVGNDVYVAGYERRSGTNHVAKVWKTTTTGGTVSTIFATNGTTDAEATSIMVAGSDIYVAGNEQNTSNRVFTKVWKVGINGGTATELFAYDTHTDGGYGLPWIAVVGTDIYVTGLDDNGTNGVAKFWKTTTNGGTASTIFITDGTKSESASLIVVQ